MFPSTVERVRGTPARVEVLVHGLSHAILTRRLGSDWSIQEQIGHLLDLESLWATRLDELIAGAEHVTAWAGNNQATYDANHNANGLDDILNQFRAVRGSFVDELDMLDDTLIERSALHPRLLTPIRIVDLAYFIAEHDDFHLAEITRLKKAFMTS